MRYRYNQGIVNRTSRRWVVFVLLFMLVVGYGLLNFFAPTLFYIVEPADATAKQLLTKQPASGDNRLYIPKINLDAPINSTLNGETAALQQGVINRTAASGNPAEGGNYVIVGNRFSFGFTPHRTDVASPFYHMGKIQNGDDIYVDFKGVRFAYKVSNVSAAEASSTEIEKRTDTKQLTLYTTEVSGSSNQRSVVVAKQVGKVIWSNGSPRLQPSGN